MTFVAILSLAVLAGCQSVSYKGINTYTEKRSDGGYLITSVGWRGGTPDVTTKVLVLRSAEFALKKKMPVIKMSDLKCHRKQHINAKYKGSEETENSGDSFNCTAVLDLMQKISGSALPGQKIYRAEDVLEEFKEFGGSN